MLAAAAILWSLGGVLIKSIQLHPLAIAGGRSAIAAVVLWIASPRFRFSWTRAQFIAAIAFAATTLLFVTSTKLTTAANAILLQYTAPVYVAIFSGPLLNEKVRRADWACLAAVAAGMAVFFMESASADRALGNWLAAASGVSFAGIALALRAQKGVSTLESLFFGHCAVAAAGCPFFLFTPPGAHPALFRDGALMLALGVFQLGIPYALYGRAIRSVTALEATLIPAMEPVLNPVWVAIFTAEFPSPHAIVGGGIVIASVVGHSALTLKSKPSADAPPPPVE